MFGKLIALSVLPTSAILFGSVIIANDSDKEPVYITEIINRTIVAPTTTTTTTTSTTTTTTIPPKPKPTKTLLMRKLDEYAPGASARYSEEIIDEAGRAACRMWNIVGVNRLAVIREILEVFDNDDIDTALALTQAVLWTICPITASFPNGPLPSEDWK